MIFTICQSTSQSGEIAKIETFELEIYQRREKRKKIPTESSLEEIPRKTRGIAKTDSSRGGEGGAGSDHGVTGMPPGWSR